LLAVNIKSKRPICPLNAYPNAPKFYLNADPNTPKDDGCYRATAMMVAAAAATAAAMASVGGGYDRGGDDGKM
ncbi:hypothetical protein Tco_1572405, partial [Tanacetum coccineum]